VAAIAPRALLEAAGEMPHHVYTRGSGCAHCRHTGYHGRRAIAELLVFDDELRDLVASRAPLGRIKQAARERGFASLHEVALGVARGGHTSLEEVHRVTIAA
jgi:general secretion pathway protein E